MRIREWKQESVVYRRFNTIEIKNKWGSESESKNQ